jgi:peptidoglycan/LPS O-acetylase OafA/YrhL
MRTVGAARIAGQSDPLVLKPTGIAPWFTVLMLATVFAPPWAQWFATNKPARRMGDISYGVYLFHIPLIQLAVLHLGFSNTGSAFAFFKMLLFVTLGSVILGVASYLLIEGPFRRWASLATRRIKSGKSAPRDPSYSPGEPEPYPATSA